MKLNYYIKLFLIGLSVETEALHHIVEESFSNLDSLDNLSSISNEKEESECQIEPTRGISVQALLLVVLFSLLQICWK